MDEISEAAVNMKMSVPDALWATWARLLAGPFTMPRFIVWTDISDLHLENG